MKHIVTLFAMLLIANSSIAQKAKDSIKPSLGINSELSYKMLEPNQDLRKINILITERQKGELKNKSLTIGASVIALADYQKSNTDSKFGYLMRHPTANNQIGKEVSEAVIHSFQFSATAAINSWLTAYAEIFYDPQQSFGAGTITTLSRNQLQLRKGYVLIGDLNKFPVYGAIGKMDAPFGITGSVNPFTNSTLWHAFGGLGYGAQVAFKKWDVHATFMAVQGGSQFRALTTPVNDSNVPSKLNNFIFDLNYTLNIKEDISLLFGGSYLHGSAYCHGFPVTHFSGCTDNNPAYTLYGKLNIKDRFTLKGGFAKTLDVWPGTHNPTPPLDLFEASKVSSMEVGAKYNFNNSGTFKYAVSGEFSNFISGPDGAPWERQNQIVLGFSALLNNSSKLFLELFRTDGYVPLNFISGSAPNAPFPAGETHSERDAFSHGIVLGVQLTL